MCRQPRLGWTDTSRPPRISALSWASSASNAANRRSICIVLISQMISVPRRNSQTAKRSVLVLRVPRRAALAALVLRRFVGRAELLRVVRRSRILVVRVEVGDDLHDAVHLHVVARVGAEERVIPGL